MLEFPDLPVTDALEKIEAALIAHQVVIVVGETGSGKTTQLPKLCLKMGFGRHKQIVHTQPRRLAARSVAARIADELHTPLGELCGYQVRFERQVQDSTPIKLVTDGLLLAEFRNDRLLECYDTVIIDEAHERSLNIDFLLGILKTILNQRPDLKVIVTSATINYEKFSAHFADAPVIQVSGRTHPVEIQYHPMDNFDASKLEAPRLAQAIQKALFDLRAIDREKSQILGDILVFLPGEREIRDVSQYLRQAAIERLDVLPLYGRLGSKEQARIFHPSGQGIQRIVLATNVAETSLTVPGIRYVIDSGLARITRYSPRSRIQRLPIEPISQASANQRSGRCGRTEPGIAIRLYDQADYEARSCFTDPEILRTNLASVVLQCLDLNLGDPQTFPFVDPPEVQLIRDGVSQLRELDLLTPKGRLTPLGKQVAGIPLDPRIGRILIDAVTRKVFWEVSIVASGLSIQDPRESLFANELVEDESSQFVTLLNLWNRVEAAREELSNSKFRQWCQTEHVNYNRLREWREIHRQILLNFRGQRHAPSSDDLDRAAFHIALLTGLASQIGRREEQDYLGVRNRRFRIAKNLLRGRAQWVMAAELVETHRVVARTVAIIEPRWIVSAVPRLVKYSYAEPVWSKKQGRAVCYRATRLFGLPIIERETVGYSSVDSNLSRRLMISEGLIAGHIKTRLPFISHNQAKFSEASEIEAKLRRVDLVASPDQMVGWFEYRIPEDIVDIRSLENWWKTASEIEKSDLFLTLDDLKINVEDSLDTTHFPAQVSLGHLTVPANYQFAPGRERDGITAQVPIAALMQLTPESLEWTVPGAVGEKVEAMIRGLPKSIRRHLVPIPDFVAEILPIIEDQRESLSAAVSRCVTKKVGVVIDPDVWVKQSLDDRLKIRIEVLDDQGLVMDAGRDLLALQRRLASEADATVVSEPSQIYIDWPSRLILEKEMYSDAGGIGMKQYERFVLIDNQVSLSKLFDPKEARVRHREAVSQLLVERSTDLFRFLEAKEQVYQHALVAVCQRNGDSSLFKRLLVQSCSENIDDILSENEFLAAKGNVRERLVEQTLKIARSLESAASRARRLKTTLAGKIPAAWLIPIGSMRTHLGALIEDVLKDTPPGRMIDLDRYVEAIDIRLEKLQSRLLLDAQWQKEVEQLEDQLKRFWPTLPKDWEKQDPILVDLRWQIEEFRVLCFAQTLKSREKVSFKRISTVLKDYRRL